MKLEEDISHYYGPSDNECIESADIKNLLPQSILEKLKENVLSKYPDKKFTLVWGTPKLRAKGVYFWQFGEVEYRSIDYSKDIYEFDSSVGKLEMKRPEIIIK